MQGKLLSIVAMVTLLCTPPIAIGLSLDAELNDARADLARFAPSAGTTR